jgi:hypothetical protein
MLPYNLLSTAEEPVDAKGNLKGVALILIGTRSEDHGLHTDLVQVVLGCIAMTLVPKSAAKYMGNPCCALTQKMGDARNCSQMEATCEGHRSSDVANPDVP